jgi:hypothetical protein
MRPQVLSFPQLHELRLGADRHYPIMAAPLLPASLRKLHVAFGYESDLIPTISAHPGDLFLHSAARSVPGLTHLKVSGEAPSASVMFVVNSFDDIQDLNIAGVVPIHRIGPCRELIRILSVKRHLTVLRLPMLDIAGGVPHCQGYARLQTLEIPGAFSTTITRVIDNVTSPDIRAIDIMEIFQSWDMGNTKATLENWRMCFNTISTRFASTLRCIYIMSHSQIMGEVGLTMIETISPLLDVHLMEEVSLSLPVTWVEVDEVESIATAWPNLKVFRLEMWIQSSRAVDGANEPAPSAILCLSSFARLCPNLDKLEIQIDQTGLPTLSSLPSVYPRCRLRTLNFDVTGVGDYLHLARILHRLFPELQHVQVNKDPTPKNPRNGPWKDVPGHIRRLQGKDVE